MRWIFLAVVVAFGSNVVPLIAQEAAPEPPPPVPEPEVVESPTTDMTTRSQEALANIDRMRAEIQGLGASDRQIEVLGQLQEKVDDLLPEGRVLEDLAEDPAAIDGVLVRSRALTNQSGTLINDLTAAAEKLEAELREITDMRANWQRVRDDSANLPVALLERVNGILANSVELEALANEKLNQVIELQNATMSVRNVITPIEERINSYGRTRQTRLFEQNAAPIWSITTEHIADSSERATRRFTGTLRRDFLSWTETSEAAIGAHLLLLPLLIVMLVKLRGAASEEPSSALARPVASAVLVWMLLGVAIYASSPAAVRVLYVTVAMAVAGVLLLHYLPKTMRVGVIVFITLAVLEQFISGFPITEHLPRMAYFAASIGLLLIAIGGRRRGSLDAIVKWGVPRSFIVATVWSWVVLVVISVVANVVGYVQLAKLFVSGVIDSIGVFLVLFAGFSSIAEILEAVLSLKALDNFRSIAHNRFRLKRAMRGPLLWLSLFLWVWATARGFGIDQWLIDSILGIFLAEASFGSVTLSLRGIVGFIFAIWAAVWISRIVQAVLKQDVLSRMELPRGVPNTISMTANYSIILIGLLLGVGFMGIDLSSLAFIVGALGVGIGFGLQNLVNNFVSGLILIFEAPIQVGDTVEVGNLMGRVVQIGIRTSRVRTYSGSEVIVPNGELVSNQVINWTLSDRRRRLELGVGVAYGSDPTQVTEILRSVVENDEDVLEDPAPIIIFSEFGDSALNFRVLAWIADFDTGFGMTHKLNTAINQALADAGITIPFPQRDLHLRTVPDALSGPAGELRPDTP